MNTETTIDRSHKKPEKEHVLKSLHIWNHLELIAAIMSGVIILSAWLSKAHISHTLFVTLHLIAFVIGGYAKAKEGITETIKDKDLNVELLMFIAAIGAAAIGFWTEGAILIFIFALSGALETYTEQKSDREIASLMNLQPEEARMMVNGVEKLVPVDALQIGDIVYVRASERIPADGKIITGMTSIDESAITGESIPVRKALDEEVLAGTVALDGSISIEITKRSDETLFQKIIEMIQSAQEEKSPSQLFIERFEGTYVKIVLATVAVMMVLPHFVFGWTWTETIYRAMILLVVASPCALVASIMPATLSAISNSAKSGVLFKGGVHLEGLSQVQAVAFDKTGTLTNGTPKVTDFHASPTVDKDELLHIVGAIENESTHPLAKAITSHAFQERHHEPFWVDVTHTLTVSGKGIEATVNGMHYQVGSKSYVGSEDAQNFLGNLGSELAQDGKTIVYIRNEQEIVGLLGLKDTVREDTKEAIERLKERGIYTIMLTGDNELTAQAIAAETGIDAYIAGCLPEDKVTEVKKLQEKYGRVAMVGDGINDAPALATAHIGIAMGEGTDVALETADVVLMKNDLPKITNAIHLSARMNRVVKQNVYFSLAVIAILIISNFFQAIDLPLGVIGHEGSTILVILNGLRLLK